MPYDIRTKDGITLKNIPDDWKPDDPRLQQAVQQRRLQLTHQRALQPESNIDRMKRTNPGDFDPESEAYKNKYAATSGMTGTEKVFSNLGAGLTNFGQGLAQLVLPKPVERAFGITDEAIDEKRHFDENLAKGTTGGKFIQLAGEAAPMFLVPGGSVARGLTKLPGIGASAARIGIGSKVLPSIMAEGGVLGAASGAITPTKSDESTLANTALGGVGGALLPAGLMGLGKLARPFVPALRQRKVAEDLASTLDTSPPALTQMQRKINASNKSVVEAPQSTAVATQNDELAKLEMAARANPETSSPWVAMDEATNNARWKALDETLGNQKTVDAAKSATDSYINVAKPEVMKAMRPKKLANGIADLQAATKAKLEHAEANRNNWASVVYKKLRDEINASNKSADSLWNIRKTLREWQEGTPPPGFEQTRAPKGDRAIQEAVGAIDEVLNRASHKRWSKFIEKVGEFSRKEAEQRAGQNIRNSFLSEVTGDLRSATTKAGNPVVTRAKLANALETHGTNHFGERLDFPQRDVVDQVLANLRADEIFGRLKKSITSGGGSHTAPLEALMKAGTTQIGGPWFTKIADVFANVGRKKQQQLINQILLNSDDAMLLLKQAQKIKRPLSDAEKRLVYAARAMMNAQNVVGVTQAVAQAQPQEQGQ